MSNFNRAQSNLLRWASVIALMTFVGWPARVDAQSSGELQTATLEDLMKITVTTASRRAEGVGDAPAQVEVITARQIRARGYQSLADLLRDQLGIKIESGTDPDYPNDITVQGSRNTSRIILLMDGIRVSAPTSEPLPIMANYPIHHARQVEIVFGPASALYGADAFSAVINIVSKDVSEAEGLTATMSAGQFGLSNHSASYGARIGSASLIVAGQWFRDAQADLSTLYPDLFGGMRAQSDGTFNTIFGPMAATGTPSQAFENPISAHSGHAVFSVGGFQATLFNSRQRASTSFPYTPDNAVYSRDAFQQNDLWVGSGAYTRRIGVTTSTSTVTFSRHELNPQSGYWNVFSNLRKSFKYAYGSIIKGEQQLSWQLPRTVVTAGGTFERFFAIPQGADLNAPVTSRQSAGTILDTDIVDDFNVMRYSNTGGFLQAQVAVNPSVSITAGTRADYNSRYGGTINPRLGAVIKPASGTAVKVLAGTAFLAPSPYQASAHYGSFYSTDGGATYVSDFWHLGNPDLKPQKKYTLEASVTQSIGSLLSVSASAFYSHMKDVIKHDDPDQAGPGTYRGWPVAYVEFPVNEGREVIHGGTVDTTFLKSWTANRRLQIRAGVTAVDGYVVDDDHGSLQLGAVAPFQFRGSVDLEINRWTASAGVMTFGNQRVLALADDGRSRVTIPGYTLVNLNLRRNQIVKNFDGFVRVENLFDARYLHINERAYTNGEELVGAPQQPRRISAGVSVRFGR
jgi:outer membrane receptor for ferrienterochelin and colicin